MKIKRILAKRICLIAGTVLSVVIGGQLSAQTMIAKKAKVYAVQMHTWTRNGTGTFKLLSKSIFGTL